MLFFSASSKLGMKKLLPLLKGAEVLLLSPKKVRSEEELLLAHALAKKAIRERRAISKSLPVESLLWLSGKRDIRRAFAEYGAKKSSNLLVVSFGEQKKKLIGRLGLKEKKLRLRKNADAEDIERISLSRI
jgi:tRNA threonylcarbamoyladenosine modification (KEOPS) complex Cgi121 subunit